MPNQNLLEKCEIIYLCKYSWSQKFTYTLQNLQNVDYFTK